MNKALIIGGMAVIFIVMGLMVVGCAGLILIPRIHEAAQNVAQKQKQNQAKALPTREEFHLATLGKTKEEVLKMYGPPKHTSPKDRFSLEEWTYWDIRRDEINNRPENARLRFDAGGKVTEIR